MGKKSVMIGKLFVILMMCAGIVISMAVTVVKLARIHVGGSAPGYSE